jgi:mannobiose 2-epimerase
MSVQGAESSADFTRFDYAVMFRQMLTQKVLPYWQDTSVDRVHGGYLLADDATRKVGPATEKQLVSQTRMIWAFSHAHLKGLGTDQRNYLESARQGYEFLTRFFLDSQYGGYYWKTDREGRVIQSRKFLYGQSFVIYALVEYYRASGDRQALQHARDLFGAIQAKLHDREHEGWFEHAERDFQLVMNPEDRRAEVEVAGRKSANAHLHWMEALSELYAVTHDRDVRQALREALKLNRRYFYPLKPGQSRFHRMPDWQLVPNDPNPGLSYGHNVEFAWLMIRAEQVLRKTPSWFHFHAIMNHALQHGYDHVLGGLYNRGFDDQPATDTQKIWWVQSEMLAALADGLAHEYNGAYAMALDKLLAWLVKSQILPADGIWLESVDASGKPLSTGKAHLWKAAYHDVRGMVKFIEICLPLAQTDSENKKGRRKAAR